MSGMVQKLGTLASCRGGDAVLGGRDGQNIVFSQLAGKVVG